MNLSQDLIYFEAGVRELEDYLVSQEVYWTISGDSTLPRLTLGGLVLARQRLGPPAETPGAELDAIRSRWQSAWWTKARQEIKSRSGLWKNYLLDYLESPASHADEYPQQVRLRAMIALLGGQGDEMDDYLREAFVPGGFIWEIECAGRFEADTFWFLFGRLK